MLHLFFVWFLPYVSYHTKGYFHLFLLLHSFFSYILQNAFYHTYDVFHLYLLHSFFFLVSLLGVFPNIGCFSPFFASLIFCLVSSLIFCLAFLIFCLVSSLGFPEEPPPSMRLYPPGDSVPISSTNSPSSKSKSSSGHLYQSFWIFSQPYFLIAFEIATQSFLV